MFNANERYDQSSARKEIINRFLLSCFPILEEALGGGNDGGIEQA